MTCQVLMAASLPPASARAQWSLAPDWDSGPPRYCITVTSLATQYTAIKLKYFHFNRCWAWAAMDVTTAFLVHNFEAAASPRSPSVAGPAVRAAHVGELPLFLLGLPLKQGL